MTTTAPAPLSLNHVAAIAEKLASSTSIAGSRPVASAEKMAAENLHITSFPHIEAYAEKKNQQNQQQQELPSAPSGPDSITAAMADPFTNPNFCDQLGDICVRVLESMYAARRLRQQHPTDDIPSTTTFDEAAPTYISLPRIVRASALAPALAPVTPPISPQPHHHHHHHRDGTQPPVIVPSQPIHATAHDLSRRDLTRTCNALARLPCVQRAPHILLLALLLANKLLASPYSLPGKLGSDACGMMVAVSMLAEAQLCDRQTSTRTWGGCLGYGDFGGAKCARLKRDALEALGFSTMVRVEEYVRWLKSVREAVRMAEMLGGGSGKGDAGVEKKKSAGVSA